MIRTATLAGAVLLLTSACAPLSQAPLVYTSMVQGGVNVSTISAETPGVDISIGYKALDAAYVPIAVARPCEDDQPTSCAGGSYDVHLVAGGNKESTSSSAPTPEELAQAERVYDDARAARAAASGKLSAATTDRDGARREKEAAQEAREKANTTLGGLAGDSPDRAGAEANVADAKEKYDQLARKLDTAESQLRDAQAGLDSAAEREKTARSTVEAIRRAILNASTDNKDDALSVFGSFDGHAGTSAEADGQVTAGLTLGKVFSTGVAAQNLTQGLGDSTARTATANCLRDGLALVKTLPVADQPARADELMRACGVTRAPS